ncbi:MAG TPA: hypothetical protein VIM58_10420 [Candidatus Methylacidiphilales bacterium]
MLALILGGFAAPASHGAPLLSVDFGATTNPTLSGFQTFSIATGNVAGPVTQSFTGIDTSLTSGTLSFTLAAGTTLTGTSTLTARDRGTIASTGTFTYGPIYEDFINPSSGTTLTMGISGLNANTQYTLTLYAYDNSNTKTLTFADYTSGTAGASGTIAFTAATSFTSTTPNDIYALTLTLTSDASGNLVIRDTASSGTPVIDGLVISAVAVPEPTTVTLLFLSATVGLALGARSRLGLKRASLSS